MRLVLYLLVALLVMGALRALLVGDGSEPASDPEVRATDAPEEGPALKGAAEPGRRPKSAPGTRRSYRPLPPGLVDAAGVLTDADAKKVWSWVAADKRRYLDLLWFAIGGGRALTAKRDRPLPPSRYIEAWRGWGIDVDLSVFLRGVLAEPGHDSQVVQGVVDSLLALQDKSEATRAALRGVVADSSQSPAARVHAANVLYPRTALIRSRLGQTVHLELGTEDVVALRALLRDALEYHNASLTGLLKSLRERPDIVRQLAPELIAGAHKSQPHTDERSTYVRALLATGIRSIEVRNALARSVHDSHGSFRKKVYEAVYGGPSEDVLAWMEQAPPHVRIIGVRQLHARGVSAAALQPHVLAVLLSDHPVAVQRAVDSLTLLRVASRDALPVLEQILRRENTAGHVLAVKGLGALGRLGGDQEDVIRRLAVVAREGRTPKVRSTVVHAILMHRTSPAGVIDVLAVLLRDADAEVRREAVDAMGEYSGQHTAAREALEAVRNDPDADVRRLIAYWLEEDEGDD